LPRQFWAVTQPEKIVAVFNQTNSGFRVKTSDACAGTEGSERTRPSEADKLENVRFYEKSGFITINHRSVNP
jgi:hypothetical protein